MAMTQNLVIPPVNGGTGYRNIHYKMCEHGREHMVKAWVLNDKGKKTPVT